MNENERKALTPSLRDHWDSIPADYFDGLPDVIAARAAVERATKPLAEKQAAVIEITECLNRHQQKCAANREEISRIDSGRALALCTALLAGDDVMADFREQERRRGLDHFVEAVTLAMPELERKQRELSNQVGNVVRGIDDANDNLKKILDQLRLAEAKRRDA